MEFYTSSNLKRPVRLSEKTRKFAYDSMNHKYGLDTLKVLQISLDHIEGYAEMTPLDRHNIKIFEICSNAPIRICDDELISGAATVGRAINHLIPAFHSSFTEPPEETSSISHFTADFFEVLEIGMDSIRDKALKSLKTHPEPYKQEFLKSCIHTIDCMKIWHERYLDALAEKGGCDDIIKNLNQVPFKPARSFYEAVQCVWFCFAFLRLLGNWPGIGRIDVLLGKYLEKDLADGKLTLFEAREILAHFFIKGCEWITGKATTSGDAQHYQNIVISGIDEFGNDVTNAVTYLVLDILEETGISDFPTTVRINKNTDEKLIKRVSEVIQFGGGVVAVYNEDLILESLARLGYSKEESTHFANDGCWEIQIPGKTNFSYIPFDALALLQIKTLNSYNSGTGFDSYSTLLDKFKNDLREQVSIIYDNAVKSYFKECDGALGEGESVMVLKGKGAPCTAVSLFEQDCIGRGLSYIDGGTVYTIRSPHIGGLPDVANSLYAIKKVVFDDKLITLERFIEILKNNWDGEEELRRHILNSYTYYGNDNDEVDSIAADILSDFSDYCMEFNKISSILFVSGVSTFGRQIDWSPNRLATPYGRKKGEILAGNMSPTPGTDKEGATAIIKSYCKADLSKQYTGAALDIGLIPSNTNTDNTITAIGGLIKSFVALGGHFMQIDTVNKATLLDAQKHPENYATLSVRVSGWNARFVTMNKEWQDMIIERT